MTRGDEMEVFLREGLKHYPDAREAVDAFEQEIGDRLATLFEQMTWTNFNPKRGERGRGKAVSPDAGGRAEQGRWINASQAADADYGAPVYLVLGLWWHCPKMRDCAVMYCSVWHNARLLSVQVADPTPPVKCGPLDRAGTRLFVVLDGEFDIEETGGKLLADLDRALGAGVLPAVPASTQR